MRGGWVLVVVFVTGCGRFGFDRAGGDDTVSGDGSTGDGSAQARCADLPKTCGLAASDSCCTSLQVPGGAFYRSYDPTGDGYFSVMAYPAQVSAFALDTYEVTVGRFRQFVDAGYGTQQKPPSAGAGARAQDPSGWAPSWNAALAPDTAALRQDLQCEVTFATWTNQPGPNEDRPINCITWYDAYAFCLWDGGFLPTETEWNFAASGGNMQRAYPWSSPATSVVIDATHASYWVDDVTECIGDSVPGCAAADIVRVGSKPAGNAMWGHADMGGNLWEWVIDYTGPYSTPCVDCAILAEDIYRGTRGGGFFDIGPLSLRAGYRNGSPPDTRIFDLGVRCARAQPR